MNKKQRSDTANKTEKWFEKNRSLVLANTIWAQSVVGVLISVGVLTVTAGLVFKIDEVITVTGQLESISGSVDIKAPVGGKLTAYFLKMVS